MCINSGILVSKLPCLTLQLPPMPIPHIISFDLHHFVLGESCKLSPEAKMTGWMSARL